MGAHHDIASKLHRLGLALALAVFTGFAAASLADDAGAAKKRGRVVVMGAAKPVAPSCNPKRCFVEARVSGIQSRIGNRRKPFRVRNPGRIVAWSIKLGKPSKDANECFTKGCDVGEDRFEGFGGPAKARIGVFALVPKFRKQGKPVFKLLRQSPVEVLTPFFGSTATFALRYPLKVGRGTFVGLTIPTWAPAFAGGLSRVNKWRASRRATKKRGPCTLKDASGNDIGANVRAGAPHQKKGGNRWFGCVYSSNRLLYSATLVKRPG